MEIKKLADMLQAFEEKTKSDLFGKDSYTDDAKKLYAIAGRIHHKASQEQDEKKSERLKSAAKLILAAHDIVKSL